MCGDGPREHDRSLRELRALAPSLLKLPFREPGCHGRPGLSGRQPRWHRPPTPPEPAPVAARRELVATLVESLAPAGPQEWLRRWLRQKRMALLTGQFTGESPGQLPGA